jgi:hypothetical protein
MQENSTKRELHAAHLSMRGDLSSAALSVVVAHQKLELQKDGSTV